MIGAALYVFTVITVAVNQVHLAVPLAVTVALIVATIKGSMVAAVFMHLSHEKRWIYGALHPDGRLLHRAHVSSRFHDDGSHRTHVGVGDAPPAPHAAEAGH